MKTDPGKELRKEIFTGGETGFTEIALKVFDFQYNHNPLYRTFCNLLKRDPRNTDALEKIPFLPISFFKTKEIRAGAFEPECIFESSGTTGSVNSRHFVKDKTLYEESFLRTFRAVYGDEKNWCILGLLPSYLERADSSLVYMVKELIRLSGNEDSGFYLYDHDKLKNLLLKNEAAQQPTLLIGVTYALLDFAEKQKTALHYTTVMETGGMKGRRASLSRSEVHRILTNQLGVKAIHSEYGMTELLSQAYSTGQGIFSCPPQMRILVRSEDDPFEITSGKGMSHHEPLSERQPKRGAVNIIDLANLYSCAFIATDDAGKIYPDGSFEIIGRLDNSDVRGCSLMVP